MREAPQQSGAVKPPPPQQHVVLLKRRVRSRLSARPRCSSTTAARQFFVSPFFFANEASDSHLPQLRQLLEDPRRLQHGELVVVQAPGTHNAEVVRHNRGVSSPPPLDHGRRAKTHSSAVYCGMWSGILVSFWLEQSTVVPSQRHFSGQARSAKQSPPSLLR